MKRCGHCRLDKDERAFYERKDRPGMLSSWCKSCVSTRMREIQNERREAYLLYERKRRLKRDFGLTLEDYEVLLQAQRGVCAICGRPEGRIGRSGLVKMLSVDHNHATGKIRALLCHGCNCGLGNFSEQPELLTVAAAYLTRHVNAYPKGK